MTPLKISQDHKEILKLRPAKRVDLRDIGMAAAAPCEDGKTMLVFRVRQDGTLLPAA